MSLERGIHNWWTRYAPLTEALPAAKFYTGMAPVKLKFDPNGGPVLDAQGQQVYELLVDLPFCTLEQVGVAESVRTSSGTILEAVQVKFDVWDSDLDRAKPIVNLIREWFNRAGFEYDGGKVNDIKFVGRSESEDNQATWHVTLDAIVRTAEQSAMAGMGVT